MRRQIAAVASLSAAAIVAVLAVSSGASLTVSSSALTPTAHETSAANADADDANGVDALPTRWAVAKRATAVSNITYHGGPLITITAHVYYVWYGNWSTNTAGQQVLTDFVSGLSGSPYYAINGGYTNAAKVAVSPAVTLAGQVTDAYSQGTTLTDASVRNVVANAIGSGKLTKDVNGLYVVLTSPDVRESSGFITKYCGWHTHSLIAGVDVKYAFVGDPTTQGLGSCAWQTKKSPNNVPGADAMVSVVAHEIDETVTDPDLNAWSDSAGYENADKCAWTFGTTYTTANGALANVKLGARDYLVQQNWKIAANQGCALS